MIFLALALSLILSATAYAAPVTFSFTGTINNAPIGGSYTFESTALLNDTFSQAGGRVAFQDQGNPGRMGPLTSYAGAITAATVNWDGVGQLNPAVPIAGHPDYGQNGITVLGNYGDYHDLYGTTFRVQGLTGFDWFGLALEGKGFLPNRSLPLVPPSLNLVQSARVELFNLATGAFVQGQLTSLTAVPIPPSVWLFGAGLLVLIWLNSACTAPRHISTWLR